MRKLLASLLMLIMITPSLVCGPFMGYHKAQASPSKVMMSMPNCHEMAKPVSGHKFQKSDIRLSFFKDCFHIELQTVDYDTDIKNPAVVYDIAMLMPAEIGVHDGLISYDTIAIRGPPPDWPNLSQTQPTILQTTQRVRD